MTKLVLINCKSTDGLEITAYDNKVSTSKVKLNIDSETTLEGIKETIEEFRTSSDKMFTISS